MSHLRVSRLGAIWSIAIVAALLSLGACRRTVPIIDTAPEPAQVDGTISGTVRGPAGTSAIEGRAVEAINLATGDRHRAVTNNAGGFTFKLAPGTYRIELTLLDGESIVKRPGTITLDRSDVDAFADFIVGSSRVSSPRPRHPASGDHGLGAPVA